MARTALISISAEDRIGLVAAISGRLFDLGANLGDTAFAVLGGGCEFTTVCELPGDVDLETVRGELEALNELDRADIKVAWFQLPAVHGESGTITHRISVRGGDRPGLIARLCEVFQQFGANIVRLNAEKIPGAMDNNYTIRISVWIPEGARDSCLAAVTNTAGALSMSCTIEQA